MLKYLVIIIIIIITTYFVDARNNHMKNYMKNLNKNIVSYCNNQAHLKTKSEESYNCMISNNDCSHIDNFTEYMNIRNECIKEKRNSFTIGLLYALLLIIFMGLFS